MNHPTLEQVQAFARQIAHNARLAKPDAKALHCYRDEQGEPIYWRVRLKNTSTGEKWIRPFYWNGTACQLGEPPVPEGGKPLYALELLAQYSDAVTIVVEGENCADAINKLSVQQGGEFIATTSGSTGTAQAANWKPLADRQVIVWPDNDEPGRKYASDVESMLQGIAASIQVLNVTSLNLPTKGDVVDWMSAGGTAEKLQMLVKTALSAHDAYKGCDAVPDDDSQPDKRIISSGEYVRDVNLIRACDISPEPICWLWKGWIAAGKMHVLGGAPGTGKTTITMSLASTVTVGGRWPDGSSATIGNVVIWSGEDDPADTLIPRLSLSGADLRRIFFIGEIRDGDERRSFDPARDMEPLRRKLMEIGNVRLLVVDPIVSAIAGDSHKNAEVRRSLQPLVDLAASMHCALLGITHFSKGTSGRDPVERLTGSLAFGALARVVLVAAKHQEEGDDGRTVRLFCRAKSNIGPDDGGFEYDLHQAELKSHLGIFASSVLWGNAVEGAARELLATADATGDDGEGGTLSDAKRFLASLLADGPMRAGDVIKEADQAGYSKRSIQRAANAI